MYLFTPPSLPQLSPLASPARSEETRSEEEDGEDGSVAKAISRLDETASRDLATLSSWSLDADALAPDRRHTLLAAMLHAFGLFSRFKISPLAFAQARGGAAPFPSSIVMYFFNPPPPLLPFPTHSSPTWWRTGTTTPCGSTTFGTRLR